MAAKSAINEVRNQLFLDRAEGKYLSRVSSNLGLERPLFGFSNDDIWRAVVRRMAFDYRQIANLFEDFLLNIFGPKTTVASVLSVDAALLDEEVSLTGIERFPQRGTFVIDETLATEESVAFSFLDPRNNLASLSSALVHPHTAVLGEASGFLISDVSAAGTNLVLVNSSEFPTAGFPLTLLVDAGTANEEVVQLTGHTPATNTLTVSALANDHTGARPTFITSRLSSVVGTPANGISIIRVKSSVSFPNEGLIRVSEDGGSSEVVEYFSNDTDTGTLQLRAPLSGTYTTPWAAGGGASVTLLRTKTEVRLAQVQVKGIGWDIYETIPRKLQLYIPNQIATNRLQDASFVHQKLVSPAPSSTLAAGTSIGDTVLTVPTGDSDDFPLSGVIKINSGGGTEEDVAYNLVSAKATTQLYATAPTGIPATATELFVADAKSLATFDEINPNKQLILARNDVPNVEVVTYTNINVATNKVTLAAGTANAHSTGDEVVALTGDTFYLSRALQNTHSGGETVDLIQDVYLGTDLEDGQIFSTDYAFQGPYLYGLGEDRAIEDQTTTLDEDISGPLELMVDARAGRYSLEVRNADLMVTTGVFDVQIGRTKATNEVVAVKTVVLASTVAAAAITVNATNVAGDTQLTLTATAALPQPSSTPYGYRLAVGGQGGPGTYEIVVVRQVISGTVIALEEPLTQTHNASEKVSLLNDVIELSDPLQNTQRGLCALSNRLAAPGTFELRDVSERVLVEELRTYVAVASSVGFTSSGSWAYLNFGRGLLPVESQLTATQSAGSSTVVLEDSSSFPTSYPYYVLLGSDDPAQVEWAIVTNNNTGINTLTVSPVTKRDHRVGTWARYAPGEPVAVEFTGTDAGKLTFTSPVKFSQAHLTGEPVQLSGIVSQPDVVARDHPFYLPSDWADRLQFLFDRGRAAGVEVVVISDQ